MSTSSTAIHIPVFGYCFYPDCMNRQVTDKFTYKRCSGCRMITYCSSECQKTDWHFHKKFCKSVSHTPRVKTKSKKEWMETFIRLIWSNEPVFSLSRFLTSRHSSIRKQIDKCISLMLVSGNMKCGTCLTYIRDLHGVDSHITCTRLSTNDISTMARSPGSFDTSKFICLAKLRLDVRCAKPTCVISGYDLQCDINKSTQIFLFGGIQGGNFQFTFILQLPIGHYLLRDDT
jgi:hypothetical protein